MTNAGFSANHIAFMAAILDSTEPKHFKDDVLIKEWCDSMTKEIEAFEANHTRDITDLPHGKKVINSKWVYKLKCNSDVCSLLAVAAAKDWEVHQMNVHNAFLHGNYEEEVYMKLPQGFQCSDPTKYALDIINEVGLLGCQPSVVPIELIHNLATIKGPVYANPEKYRRLVGRLIYLTITRPSHSISIYEDSTGRTLGSSSASRPLSQGVSCTRPSILI
ncbi:PREDICTED: uncharacterized protein LOC104728583 [Camelina sativa]|uniref:Uncharacterized protein LOC104728583 n=1 Tax=Camelina sativa TaxID=90675 RepID=A0ABM0UT11_CAMSA|nr:PREDICTED: uncharacterized protein LOC104728583 [Camelina sativa]